MNAPVRKLMDAAEKVSLFIDVVLIFGVIAVMIAFPSTLFSAFFAGMYVGAKLLGSK